MNNTSRLMQECKDWLLEVDKKLLAFEKDMYISDLVAARFNAEELVKRIKAVGLSRGRYV